MAENEITKLLIRRGDTKSLTSITLDKGELGYTTDTKRLYVGDGTTSGGILINYDVVGDDIIAVDTDSDKRQHTISIKNEAVTTAKIKDGAVTTDKIYNNAVTEEKLNTVVQNKLNGVVTEAKIDNNAVTTDKIANNAVTTNKIKDGNVTEAKLGDDVKQMINDAKNHALLDYSEGKEVNTQPLNETSAFIAPADGVCIMTLAANFNDKAPNYLYIAPANTNTFLKTPYAYRDDTNEIHVVTHTITLSKDDKIYWKLNTTTNEFTIFYCVFYPFKSHLNNH